MSPPSFPLIVFLVGLSLAAASEVPDLGGSPEESIAKSLADQWGLTTWRGWLGIAGEQPQDGKLIKD